MSLRKIIVQCLITVFLSARIAFGQAFVVEYSDDSRTLTIQSSQVSLKSEWIAPSTDPAVSGGTWNHLARSEAYDALAGIPGKRTTDVFSNPNIELERQVWTSDDGNVMALRQKLTNLGEEPFRLQSMVPLACMGTNAFSLKDNPEAGDWTLNVQKRRKNEFPVSLKPSANEPVRADPFLAVSLNADPAGPCLLIGYLDWLKHLAHISMDFQNGDTGIRFSEMQAVCEFDNVAVPPGGERTTQWIYLSGGEDFVSAVDEYADRVARYHGVREPARDAPSVYCSWYWYGANYNEEYFRRDLRALKDLKNRKPFDVFLIDECWQMNQWGDYEANERFPGGMKSAADRIRELGYIPGIWTPPYLVSPESELHRNHPEWVLRDSKGEHYTFRMNNLDHLVIDPTYPGVLEHLEESFRKLSGDWGFEYFKFDFMRAVFLEGDYRFYDARVNRLEAYRMGLEAIRRGVGDDAYISVCGGHYGGSIGIANSQRSGSDVVSYWDAREIPKYRQNILRTWMSRLWHVDPDAMMVRRNEASEFTGSHAKLSLGLFNEDEARVNALNQYIGGGLVTFTENYATLDPDRLELYKHVIPSVNSSSRPVDWYDPLIPSTVVTQIVPLCPDLERFNTIAIINWTDQRQTVSFALDGRMLETLPGHEFLLFEFFSQEVKGICKRGGEVHMGELDPHTGCLIKAIPWDGKKPVPAGTDLHFSMGGLEIRAWEYDAGTVTGVLETEWMYPVRITTAFPSEKDGFEVRKTILQPGQKRFWVERTVTRED